MSLVQVTFVAYKDPFYGKAGVITGRRNVSKRWLHFEKIFKWDERKVFAQKNPAVDNSGNDAISK